MTPKLLRPVALAGALVFLLLLAVPVPVHAQDFQDQDPGQALNPAQNVIEMDIRTSTLSELASWSRRHGLPEGGTSADLARRLREHYGLPQAGHVTVRDGQRIITIESARATEYFTIQEVNEEYARLSGDVVITLREGDAVHEIRAWDILFNRTRNIITAAGGVQYRRTEGDTIETFRGDSITVDLDNWASIFLGGISERAMEGTGTTYLFAGTVISRDEEEVTVLRDATISSTGEESLWSLRASRVWLLPGADFAIANAVLRVGEIPVFYFPFFFFPADQMVFHPAIGTRSREGNFVNTTTYILGRPRNEGGAEGSLTTMLGAGGDMERRREGIFLRSTGRRAGPMDGPSLSLLIDYYTNLGAYIGTEMSLPGTGIFGTTNISMGIGLTRTLARHGGSYTPILPDTDEVDWNWSMLFGMRVPFRYRFVADGSLRGRFGSLTWTIPHHSDPYMERDFMHRLTNMDWLNMIQQGGVDGMDVGGGTRLSSYTWNFNLAVIQPNLPGLRPYIQSITIGNISSSLQFRSFTAAGWTGIQASSPMRFFFAPEVATLYNTRVTVTGTPLRLGGGGAGQIGGAAAVPVTPEPVNPLEGIGVPISPFAVGEDDEPPPPRDPADTLVPPVLAQRFDLPRVAARNTTFTLDYNLSPTSASTLRFDGGDWREFDDVDWGDVRSVLTNVVTSGHIGTNFRFHDNFLTNTFRLGGTATWQQYTYLNEEATDFVVGGTPDSGRIDAARLQRYEGTNFTTTYNLSTDLRPFHRHPVFGASSLRHTMAGFAIGNEFAGTVDNPEWNMRFGQWSRERNGITGHSLGATVSARVMDMTQSITFAANLAPLIPRYSVNGNFNVWRTTTTASWAIRFPDDADPVHEPFNLNHTIRFGTFGNFNQVFQMDTDNVELTRLTSTLNLTRWRLTLTYRAGYIPGFEFDTVRQDWVARPEDQRQLRSEAFVVNFGRGIERRPQNAMINTFSANFNTATTFNLQRYTDSNFTFNISTTLNARLLNLTLTASSINNQIFRYFKNWPMFNDVQIAGMPDGRMNNPFLDLLDSFRFDNVDLRRRSGFKIQHFTLTAERALGDWNATLTLRMAPARATGANWEIRNRVDFVVRWIPITEFRSEISYDQTRDQRWIVEGL